LEGSVPLISGIFYEVSWNPSPSFRKDTRLLDFLPEIGSKWMEIRTVWTSFCKQLSQNSLEVFDFLRSLLWLL
jgi:hypothetical protein